SRRSALSPPRSAARPFSGSSAATPGRRIGSVRRLTLAAAVLALLAGGLLVWRGAVRRPPRAHPKFDVHEHVSPALLPEAVAFANARGIYGFVNLSGGWVGGRLEAALEGARPFEGK